MTAMEIGLSNVFGTFLLESIDEVFSTLGGDVKVSIYFYLESMFGIKKHEVPQRIAEVSDALEQIFGLGARFLEIMFMKNLHDKIGIVCESDSPTLATTEVSFQGYVGLMKQKFVGVGMGERKIEVFVAALEKQEQYC